MTSSVLTPPRPTAAIPKAALDGHTLNGTALGLHWDRMRRELRLGSVLVKRFRVPALNQELILAAFQELGWPQLIDDPLAPTAAQDPKQRLHQAIDRLNRSQIARRIRFRGNGTGKAILWEIIPKKSPTKRRRRPAKPEPSADRSPTDRR
jgi:hypothetical protein